MRTELVMWWVLVFFAIMSGFSGMPQLPIGALAFDRMALGLLAMGLLCVALMSGFMWRFDSVMAVCETEEAAIGDFCPCCGWRMPVDREGRAEFGGMATPEGREAWRLEHARMRDWRPGG